MASTTLTAENFEKTILEGGTVFVDFWAEWCGPCKRFGPVFEAASEKHADVVFGKVDTEAEQALAAAANITSIPMLMGFRDGILVFAQAGALPATDARGRHHPGAGPRHGRRARRHRVAEGPAGRAVGCRLLRQLGHTAPMSSWSIQALGWAGSALLIFSLLQQRVLRFRLLNLTASCTLIVFNAMLHVWPMVGHEHRHRRHQHLDGHQAAA